MPRMLFAMLGLLSFIWGGSFFFIKVLLHDFEPWTIAFLRSSFGFVTILLIMLLLRQPVEFKKTPWVPMIAVSLLNSAIPWALISLGETRITSSMASALNATTPLWTMICGMLFFQTSFGRQQWMGMGIGMLGLVILLDINPASIISVDLYGFLYMVSASLCYELAVLLSKRYLGGLSMYEVALFTLLGGVVASGIVAFSTETIPLANLLSWSTISILIGLGTFSSGIAYILFYYLIQKGSPEFASMVTYIVPVTAILWGYTLLNEAIHWSLLAGLLLILGGVFLAGRKPAENKESVKKVQEVTSA